MVINKAKNTEALSIICPLADILLDRTSNEKTKKELNKIKSIFSHQVYRSVFRLECSSAETGIFLYDMIKMISTKNHLALCALAGKGTTLEALNRLKRISNLTEFYFVIPTESKDDCLTIYIGSYLPAFGEKYDIYLAVKRFLS